MLIDQLPVKTFADRKMIYKLESENYMYVNKGDVVGWYTPTSETGPLTYSKCVAELVRDYKDCLYEKEGLQDMKIWKTQTFELQADTCRNYSVQVVVKPGIPGND